jgi:hypothetical protein
MCRIPTDFEFVAVDADRRWDGQAGQHTLTSLQLDVLNFVLNVMR